MLIQLEGINKRTAEEIYQDLLKDICPSNLEKTPTMLKMKVSLELETNYLSSLL